VLLRGRRRLVGVLLVGVHVVALVVVVVVVVHGIRIMAAAATTTAAAAVVDLLSPQHAHPDGSAGVEALTLALALARRVGLADTRPRCLSSPLGRGRLRWRLLGLGHWQWLCGEHQQRAAVARGAARELRVEWPRRQRVAAARADAGPPVATRHRHAQRRQRTQSGGLQAGGVAPHAHDEVRAAHHKVRAAARPARRPTRPTRPARPARPTRSAGRRAGRRARDSGRGSGRGSERGNGRGRSSDRGRGGVRTDNGGPAREPRPLSF